MQFSLFGAAAATPDCLDLDGVLLAGGQWVRSGTAARLSVVVPDRWRADALAEGYEERGVGGDAESVAPSNGGEEGFAARTVFAEELSPYADRWTRGANQGPPSPFALTPGGLRLWAISSGRIADTGYLLATGRNDAAHRCAGSALAELGLAAVALTARAGGPGWRVTSVRRVRRLAELLGEPPPGGADDWPRG